MDPLSSKYPYNSPYAFSENRVIDSKELEGAEKVQATVTGELDGDKSKGETTDKFAAAFKFDNATGKANAAVAVNGQYVLAAEYNVSQEKVTNLIISDDPSKLKPIITPIVDPIESTYNLPLPQVAVDAYINAKMKDPAVTKAINEFSGQIQNALTNTIGIKGVPNMQISQNDIAKTVTTFFQGGGNVKLVGYSGASTIAKGENNTLTKITYTYILRVTLPAIDYRGLRLTGTVDITFEETKDITPKPAAPEAVPTYETAH